MGGGAGEGEDCGEAWGVEGVAGVGEWVAVGGEELGGAGVDGGRGELEEFVEGGGGVGWVG